MHHPESDTQMLRRDSSQTLNKGPLHHAIGEEEECQLPKQVHVGEFHAPYVDTADEEENGRSYRSSAELHGPTKNMKESFDSKVDYRIESRTLAQKFIQSKERSQQSNGIIHKSPQELAKKYEGKFLTNNVSQYSENDTKMTKISRSNTLDQHVNVVHELKDLSLDHKISKIDMIHESSNGLSQNRQSLNGSYFGERDSQKDNDGNHRPLRSHSRSNPRKQNHQYPNLIIPDKNQSPSDPKIIEDEITERIRLQGEKLIQQPEIVENQPHKQLERAMKDQKSSGRRKDTQIKLTDINLNDKRVEQQPNKDSIMARKHYSGFSRDTSNGREEGQSKLEIFDGSFGRKKREDADYEKDRKFRYKIEAPALLNEHITSYDQRRPTGGTQFSSEMFEGKFGSKGPSGRANKSSRIQTREMFGIGSGIAYENQDRSSATFRQSDNTYHHKRESKSIPRDIGAYTNSFDNKKYEENRGDKSFTDLIKGTQDPRRTFSTSPYGSQRNSISFKTSDQDYRSKFMNIENGAKDRYRSPLDDLYKQHNNKNNIQKQEEPVDKQFQQCQELLQRAKDRRMKMSQDNKDSEVGAGTSYPARTSYHASKSTSLDYPDSYKIPADIIDVPDVKALQTRYEYLMDTIKEKESEASRTENSLTKSAEGDKRRGSSYAKTMKWKKGEKHLLPPSGSLDVQQISEYKSRPLRVPKPPQNANQKSNINSTYDWLMKKHEDGKTEIKPHHVISFGQFQDGSNDSLKNSQAFPRASSLGKTQYLPNENEPSYLARIRNNDLSTFSRGRSGGSNERSFYKPLSPEVEQSTLNINRMQYVPFNQKSQERGTNDNSLERENIRIPGGDYQMKIYGTQPQVQKKFQIERRTYDNLASSNNYELAFPTKTYEQQMPPSKLYEKPPPLPLPSQSQELHKQLMSSNQDSISISNYGTQSNTQAPAVAGQIGKIVRQGPKLTIDKQASFQSTQHIGEFENSLKHSTTADPHLPANTTLASNPAFNKSHDGQIPKPSGASSHFLLNQDSANGARQPLITSQQTTAIVALGTDAAPSISPSLTTPKTGGTQSQAPANLTVFQRLDRVQAQMKTVNSGDAFKYVFYSKYQPSFQYKQFNSDFISDIVSQMENLSSMYIAATNKGGKNELNPLSSLDFNAEEVNSFEQIGQHLNDQYDTKKDPNMWVPQLYADMCKARTLATKNEDDYKKEKEKNKELMEQIETLEKDLLAFRKDLAGRMDKKGEDGTASGTNRSVVDSKVREMREVEFEWMERIDALISSQKYYKQGDAPGLLPENAYDMESANPKKVFSQILNKLEVLLCHQELEKSKTKKLMTTTVKQMDSRITAITEKFSKIQRKIIETCALEDDNEEQQHTYGTESVMSSNPSEVGSECPTMRGTIDMLKKIRRDRDEQEKIIEQLKQIIQIQDKVYKADFDKLDASFRDQVIRNIENFVTEEHKKAPRSMQLAWVAEVSEISMSQDILDSSRLQRVSQSALLKGATSKSPRNASMLVTDYAVGTDDQSTYVVNKDQNQTADNFIKIEEQFYEVRKVNTEVQTDMNFQEKVAQSTKVYKEINIQTDPVEVARVASSADEGASEHVGDHKSTTTTERRTKQLNAFSADLQHNMNELLTQQLSKHLQSNLNEIATIKQENGRLIEKYKNEQKQAAKLKEELKRKQKYEQFFEKQRAKKYRNCGCQVGPSQLKFALDDQHSSSYHLKSTSSAAIKSQQTYVQTRRVNKENQSQVFEKLGPDNIALKNILKSPMPSALLRSPDGHDTAKSATDFTSLNTQVMQQKYGVVEGSTDEKHVEFTGTRGNSQVLNGSGDYSKCASYTAESPLASGGLGMGDLNHSEKQLLSYHIKRNQELHELLRTYLTKFDGGAGTPQDAQAMMAWLQPPPNIIEGSSDTLNQRCADLNTSKEHEEQAATSMLASSANFGLREPLKDSKGTMYSHEKKKAAPDPSQQLSLEFSEQTENTKKCDYIDQYFNYKNSQKRELAQAVLRRNEDPHQLVHQQSFGEQYALQAALALGQRSSSGKRAQDYPTKQVQMFDKDSKGDASRSERRSKKTEGDEHVVRQDDNVSDNINVSEQIKSIEGRQMMLCEALEAKTQPI